MSKLFAPFIGKLFAPKTKEMDFQAKGVEALEVCKRLLAKDGIALPSDAWLSGQAFASLVSGRKVVVNDIDVFKVAHYDNQGEDKMMTKKISIVEIQSNSYDQWIGTGSLTKYKVVATTNIGLMNLTNITFDGFEEESNHGDMLVKYFDINSTQCAINTSTLEVVWTKAFESYCKTNTLEITNCATIGHSLVRLVKKADELKAHCNFAKEFDKFLGEEQMFTPFFGEKIFSTYCKYKDIFDEHCVVPEELEFEDRKYPLFKMTRIASPLRSRCLRLNPNIISTLGFTESSNFLYEKTLDEIQEVYVNFEELIVCEKNYLSFLSYDSTIFVNKYFDEIESVQEGKKILSSLYEVINNNELYLATVSNGSESLAQAVQWIEVLQNKKATRYIGMEANKMVKGYRGFLTIEEVLNNLAPFSAEEFIDSVPSFGQSNTEKANIFAVVQNLYVIEMEKLSDDIVEVFGVEKHKESPDTFGSKRILLTELYNTHICEENTAFVDSELNITGEESVLEHITYPMDKIEIVLEEVPF